MYDKTLEGVEPTITEFGTVYENEDGVIKFIGFGFENGDLSLCKQAVINRLESADAIYCIMNKSETANNFYIEQSTKKPVQGLQKERKDFEKYWRNSMNLKYMDLYRCNFEGYTDLEQPYACHETNRAWQTWQARAKIGVIMQ